MTATALKIWLCPTVSSKTSCCWLTVAWFRWSALLTKPSSTSGTSGWKLTIVAAMPGLANGRAAETESPHFLCQNRVREPDVAHRGAAAAAAIFVSLSLRATWWRGC
jgi:hypothetical protein